jgi:hypothetical protein
MDIKALKSSIIKQIDQLQSEEALREVDRFILSLGKVDASPNIFDAAVDTPAKADEVFAKAVERYHNLLQKLAQ